MTATSRVQVFDDMSPMQLCRRRQHSEAELYLAGKASYFEN